MYRRLYGLLAFKKTARQSLKARLRARADFLMLFEAKRRSAEIKMSNSPNT